MIFFLALFALGFAQASERSLEQMDSAANFLTWIVDHPSSEKSRLFCKISSDEAEVLLRALHARMDQEIQATETESQGTLRRVSNWAQNCERNCHCGLYARLMEDVPPEKLNSGERAELQKLQKLAANQSPQQLQSCVKAMHGFCKSPLLKSLKRSAKDF